MDDGDRIRSLDPRQPLGARVGYESVDDVQPGTYLVLREGATERGAMYEAAMATVGMRAPGITETQASWKQSLGDRLAIDGTRSVIAQLKARAGLEIRHVENLREHYALTLRVWVRNLSATLENEAIASHWPRFRASSTQPRGELHRGGRARWCRPRASVATVPGELCLGI
jgi:Mycolic acid cyclopropane synthetase